LNNFAWLHNEVESKTVAGHTYDVVGQQQQATCWGQLATAGDKQPHRVSQMTDPPDVTTTAGTT
jgi:hypothetical protein